MTNGSTARLTTLACALAISTLASCGSPSPRRPPAADNTGDTGGGDEGGSGGSGGGGTGGGGGSGGGSSTGGRSGSGGSGGTAGSGDMGGSGGSAGSGDMGGQDASPMADADDDGTPDGPKGGKDSSLPKDVTYSDDGAHPDSIDDPFPPGAVPIGAGWTEIFPNHNVDHPPGQTRYTESNGKFHMWLFNDDMSTFPGRDAGPRSEIRWINDYTTGQAQFQGDFYIDHDCAHANVLQIFGATGRSTAAMFWAMPNALSYYGMQTVYTPGWDNFFRVNLTHDTVSGEIVIYVNGQMKAKFMDHGAANHYFKSGIYHQPNMTPRCDVYIQNVHIYKK